MPPTLLPLRVAVALGLCVVLATACAPRGAWCRHFADTASGARAYPHQPVSPRGLAMFDGRGGLLLGWTDLLEAVRLADVVIVGEEHKDAAGHAVELALVQDALANWPKSALSMEMLERDDQPAVDDYLAGKTDRKALIERTNSADWAGKGTWGAWYQPLVDAAKQAGAQVVAASAPHRYVVLARTEGYAALRKLDPKERALFDLPDGAPRGAYSRRFREAMSRHAAPAKPAKRPEGPPTPRPGGTEEKKQGAAPTKEQGTAPGADAPQATKNPQGTPDAAKPPEKKPKPPRPLTPREVAAMFRSQQFWDATMAASIQHAHEAGAEKVLHLVGGFHSDYDGGLVERVRRRAPGLRILTVALEPVHSRRLRRGDRGRADVVIYTGCVAGSNDTSPPRKER